MKVFLVLTSDYVRTMGCFKTKKDCKKFINGSDSYVIKKLDVETYEPNKSNTDFHKQILEADKELQRVCKANVCAHLEKYKLRFYNKGTDKTEIQNRCFACDQLL